MNKAMRSLILAVLVTVPMSITSGALGFDVTAILADLTGTWTVTIQTQQGDFDTTWKLEQHEDNTLSGSVDGRQGSAEVEDGWVKDNTFAFSMTRNFNGQAVVIEYEGTLTDDDTLEGKLTAGGGQFTVDFIGVRVTGGEE